MAVVLSESAVFPFTHNTCGGDQGHELGRRGLIYDFMKSDLATGAFRSGDQFRQEVLAANVPALASAIRQIG
jgi:hypothetical protein